MGKHSTPEELKSQIMKGTMHLVAEGGMSNFSFPKLMQVTGISAPTVYEHFKNKEVLLKSCFMKIDSEVICLVESKIEESPGDIPYNSPEKMNDVFQLIWLSYWKFLLSDREKTLFYWRYYNSEFYTKKLADERVKNFIELIEFVNLLDLKYNAQKEHNFRILLENIINSTVRDATKVLCGIYENNDVTAKTVYKMIFQPVFSILDINTNE